MEDNDDYKYKETIDNLWKMMFPNGPTDPGGEY